MHRPQHIVIPGHRITDKEGILNPAPLETILTDSVSNVVVVRQGQVKQMVNPLVLDDINITDLKIAEATT